MVKKMIDQKEPTATNNIYTHPGQPQMQVEVILASTSTVENAPPIYTIRMRYPRIIHGEIMSHRMFSRNARSSRAVPVQTMLNEVRTIPFVPWHWGKNQKGMQAGEECNEPVILKSDQDNPNCDLLFSREEAWLNGRDVAADLAEAYMNAGYHKQIPNRLLEPFSWMDTLVTSTDWHNFLWLRDHEDAEPHLQDLARLVKQALDEADIQTLEPSDWHLPYITDADRHAPSNWKDGPAVLRKISAARCARISYKPFDGDASYEREIDRYDSLVTSDRVHASPLEHQATPDTQHMISVDLVYQDGRVSSTDTTYAWKNPSLHGNFAGWIQARKLVPNERYTG